MRPSEDRSKRGWLARLRAAVAGDSESTSGGTTPQPPIRAGEPGWAEADTAAEPAATIGPSESRPEASPGSDVARTAQIPTAPDSPPSTDDAGAAEASAYGDRRAAAPGDELDGSQDTASTNHQERGLTDGHDYADEHDFAEEHRLDDALDERDAPAADTAAVHRNVAEQNTDPGATQPMAGPESAESTAGFPETDAQHTELIDSSDDTVGGAGPTTAIGAPDPDATAIHRFDDADQTSYIDQVQGTSVLPPVGPAAEETAPQAIGHPEDFAPRGESRRPPLLVWLITGLWAALLVMCTFLYPALSGYGEAQQADLAYSFSNGNAFYDPGHRTVSAGIQNAQQSRFPPSSPLSDHRPPARADRQSLAQLGGDRAGSQGIVNTAVEHPPLYYAVGGGILKAFSAGTGMSADRAIAILRYLSMLCMLPLPLLAWAATRVLAGNGPAAVVAAALPVTVPGLVRVGASVSNEPMLVLFASCLALVLAHVLAGDLRVRTGVLAGILTGLGCLTQGFGLVFTAVVLVVYLVAGFRHRRDAESSFWPPLLAAGAVTAAVSGWWWARNVILFGTVQPHIGPGAPARRPGFDLGHYAHDFFVLMVWRLWGGIGLPDHPRLSLPLVWIWAVALVVGALLGIAFGVRGKLGRGAAATMLLPMIFVLALIWVADRSYYLGGGYLPHAQGRYLYPTLGFTAVLFGVGLTRIVGRYAARWVPFVIIVGGLATQAWAWRQLLHSWWTPVVSGTKTEITDTVKAILAWSPWPHPVTSATFIAVAVFGTLAALASIGYGARPAESDELDEDRYYTGPTSGSTDLLRRT